MEQYDINLKDVISHGNITASYTNNMLKAVCHGKMIMNMNSATFQNIKCMFETLIQLLN